MVASTFTMDVKLGYRDLDRVLGLMLFNLSFEVGRTYQINRQAAPFYSRIILAPIRRVGMIWDGTSRDRWDGVLEYVEAVEIFFGFPVGIVGCDPTFAWCRPIGKVPEEAEGREYGLGLEFLQPWPW